MTGDEHYREAERLSEMYREGSTDTNREWAMEWGPQTLAAAQVHATLALAAAAAHGYGTRRKTGEYGEPGPLRMPTAAELVDGGGRP